MSILELTGTANLSRASMEAAKPAACNWRYDDAPVKLIGPHTTRIRETDHVGEHHVAEYKGHKLRILRVIKKLWPNEEHSELVQEWQGELDGAPFGEPDTHSNAIAERLEAHVGALPG